MPRSLSRNSLSLSPPLGAMNSRQRRRRRWEEKKRRDRRSAEEYKKVCEIEEELKKLPKLNGLKLIYLTGKKERRRVKRGLRSRVFSRREVQKVSHTVHNTVHNTCRILANL